MNMREKMKAVLKRYCNPFLTEPAFLIIVDEILDAMREPSEGMVRACSSAGEQYRTGTFSAVAGYQAGIDAIKAGK